MDQDFKIVEALEHGISSKEIRSNPIRLSELLHNEFEEFGKSGRKFSKADIVNEVPSWNHHEIEITDLTFTRLAASVLLLKYQAFANDVRTKRSSIWVKDNGHWQMIFHQGTKC